MTKDGIIIETISVGKNVKMTAIDPISGVEASIVCDPKMSRTQLENTAIKKLEYLINKRGTQPVSHSSGLNETPLIKKGFWIEDES